jgi:probable F420-dependent oxidoreductase
MDHGNRERWGITIPFDNLPLSEHKPLIQMITESGYTDVWSGESDGIDGFSPLLMTAAWQPTLHCGVAIVPAFTRGPGLLAQSVAAMAEAAPGRFSFGLGSSSDVIVSRWNGIAFDDPYYRVKDMIEFIREAMTGAKIDRRYKTFEVRGFRLTRPVNDPPPIYLAALRPGMLRLAGKAADGVIVNWLAAGDVQQVISEVNLGSSDSGNSKPVIARIFVCPTDDVEAARRAGRRLIAQYLTGLTELVGIFRGPA